jgi:glycosyltransferase involved in cell wall biosynthesis
MSVQVSVVTPVHNEVGGLAVLVDEIASALAGRAFEVVAVNDGSTDGSDALLNALATTRPWLVVIHLATNFGQTAAMSAGIDASQGDVIVAIDSDGQNDPADIPALLDKITAGYDVVSGCRIGRRESLMRRVTSGLANRALRRITGIDMHDSGCSLKAYRSDVLRSLTLLRDDHRFLPALASGLGASVVEVPVTDRARSHGASHYGFGRIPRVAADLFGLWLLLRFRGRPLRAFTWLGALALTLWSAVSVGLLAMGQLGSGVIAAGIGLTTAVASLAYGASVEQQQRRATSSTGLYRVLAPPRDTARIADSSPPPLRSLTRSG